MGTRRITVSLPLELAERIERAARTTSVSAWLANAATRALEEEELRERFLRFCDDVPATADDEKQARASFRRVVGAKRRVRA